MTKYILSIALLILFITPTIFSQWNPIQPNTQTNPIRSEHPNKNYFRNTEPVSKPIKTADSVLNWIPDHRFEYRRKIQITETAGITRENFPVEFRVEFDPPAYFDSQSDNSIRLADPTNNIIPIQIYNVTWYDYINRKISAATIMFYININAGGTNTYYLYWSDKKTDVVSYDPVVNVIPTTTGYTISTSEYEVSTNNNFGGKIYRIVVGGKDIIHGTIDEYMDKSAHFSPIINPVYSDATIGGINALALNGHYMGGISDTINHDDPQITVDGPLFVEYVVRNVEVIYLDNTVAYADITYRFYKNFFIVTEKLKFPSAVSGKFWVAGWHVDQDDTLYQGDSNGKGQFDVVYMDASGTVYSSYPVTLSTPGYSDYLDATSSPNIWTRFYVFNSTLYYGLGYRFLSSDSLGVTINSVRSYWMNEGSSNDYISYYYWSGSLYDEDWDEDLDASTTRYFYVMTGRKFDVIIYYWVDYDWGFWDGEAQIRFTIRDPYGNVIDSYYQDEINEDIDPWVRITLNSRSLTNPTGTYRLTIELDGTSGGTTLYWQAYVLYLTNDETQYIYDDYLVWGNEVDLSANSGGYLTLNYAMIPWAGRGTDRYDELSESVANPLVTDVSTTVEQYYSYVTVNVTDISGAPVENAHVELIGVVYNNYYNGTTDSRGLVTFKVVRDTYTCRVTVYSQALNYTEESSITISSDGSVDKQITHDVVLDIVHLSIKFFAADEVTPIQGAKLYITNRTSSLDTNVIEFTIESDLSGVADFYIYPGEWTFGPLAYVNKGPVYYDNFTLKDSLSGDYVLDVNGAFVNNVENATINVVSDQSWVLIDLMAVDVKPLSRFEIYNGSVAQTAEWGTVLLWEIRWTDQYGGVVDLTKENTSDSYFEWSLRYSSNDSIVVSNGQMMLFRYTPSNVSSCIERTTAGVLYKIYLDTSSLVANATYYILIRGNVSYLQPPEPKILSIFVSEIPTISTLEVPNDVYWNDTETVRMHIWDRHGSPVTGADVSFVLRNQSNDIVLSGRLLETDPGTYVTTILFDMPPGKYRMYISYDKENYESRDLPSVTIQVLNRPTYLELVNIEPTPNIVSRDLVEVYWGNYNLTFRYRYLDMSRFVDIENASVNVKLYSLGVEGKVYLTSLQVVIDNDGAYEFTIYIGGWNVGTYSISAVFSKANYENVSFDLSLIIRERPTTIVISSPVTESYYNETVKNKFYLEDLLNNSPVKLDPSDVEVIVRSVEEDRFLDYQMAIFSNGTVLITYPKEELTPGRYMTIIRIEKQNYKSASERLYLEVKERPTIVDARPQVLSLVWGEKALVYVSYYDMRAGEYIWAEQRELIVQDKYGRVLDLGLVLMPSYYQGAQVYAIRIDSGKFRAGETYDIIVFLNRTYYEPGTVIIKLNVEPRTIQATFDEYVTVLKNPLTGEAKAEIKLNLTDVSEGENEPYTNATVRFYLYSGNDTLLVEGLMNVSGDVYTYTIDCSKLDVGSYRIQIMITLSNATLKGTSGNTISITLVVDYWGGSTDLMGRRVPTVIVIPILVGAFLGIGVAVYYAWVVMHIPWEVKYINKLLKMLDSGVKTFEMIDRTSEIEEIARDLLM